MPPCTSSIYPLTFQAEIIHNPIQQVLFLKSNFIFSFKFSSFPFFLYFLLVFSFIFRDIKLEIKSGRDLLFQVLSTSQLRKFGRGRTLEQFCASETANVGQRRQKLLLLLFQLHKSIHDSPFLMQFLVFRTSGVSLA